MKIVEAIVLVYDGIRGPVLVEDLPVRVHAHLERILEEVAVAHAHDVWESLPLLARADVFVVPHGADIINGFALPLKEEHKQFLMKALLPLHKVWRRPRSHGHGSSF